jgi:DNA adenine methylase
MRNASPLRYPGGKWRFANYFHRLISTNFQTPPLYFEPFAGGASLALSLLFEGVVSKIYLNDLDRAVYSFWRVVLEDTDELIDLIESTPITPTEWKKQHAVHSEDSRSARVQRAFAFFFLNRTNHSGILNAGMIGGKQQSGRWRLDARYNREELIRRIQMIRTLKSRIRVSREDGIDFARRQAEHVEPSVMYVDPPYFRSGQRLYMNFYGPSEHKALRDTVTQLPCAWVVSYDDVPEIRQLYRGIKSRRFALLHTARSARVGKEVMFFSPRLKVPRSHDPICSIVSKTR